MSATNTDWTALQQTEDMAYFIADLCLYSPESYSLDEKKGICNDMMSTSKAVLDAMSADFEQLPPEARSRSSTCSASRGSRAPRGGGMSSSARETRCTGSLRQSSSSDGC